MPLHVSFSSTPRLLVGTVLTSAAVAILTHALYRSCRKVIQDYIHSHRSALHVLPGPKAVGWLSGSVDIRENPDPLELFEKWSEVHGQTYAFQSLFSYHLYTEDTKALSHVLSHPNEFPKPSELQWILRSLVGDGLLVVEGPKHRQQRKVMNPAFELTSIMVEKSNELCDVLRAQFPQSEETESGDRGKTQLETDIFPWLNKAALDMIGLAGFGYSFDALHATDDNPNELHAAINTALALDPDASLIDNLRFIAPIFRHLPTASQRATNRAMATMNRIGNELVAQKKAAVAADVQPAGSGRDLLSLLIKANMATDLPESARMADQDVLSQVPTFLVAGHESTSTAASWALYGLATHLAVQAKLRAELLEHPTENPTMDELNSLPYLDAVVRETLRCYPPVPSNVRVAAQDSVIPLEEAVIGRDGIKRQEIRISKGNWIIIPVRRLNTSKELWGDDGMEFKPERWLASLPEAIHQIPSIFGNTLTFFAGAHACIGYRFAVTELKALLFSLIRSFKFELAVPKEDIGLKMYLVVRPTVTSQKGSGLSLPMIVRSVKTM